MSDIVIDTNVLYSWLAIVPNAKLPVTKLDALAKKDKLHITTPTIMEFVRRYRMDLPTIQKCLEPVFDGRLYLLSIGFAPISNAFIDKVRAAQSISDVNADLDALLDEKISLEGRLLGFMFLGVTAGFLCALLAERSPQLITDFARAELNRYTRALFASNEAELRYAVTKALDDGYHSGKEKKAVKQIFATLFLGIFRAWVTNYHLVRESVSLETYRSDVQTRARIDGLAEADPLVQDVEGKYADNPLKVFEDPTYGQHIDTYLSTMQADFITDPRFPLRITDSLIARFRKLISEGAKIDKNDALDLLITYALTLPGYLVLTLDRKFQDILLKTDTASYEYIKSAGAL